MNAKIMSRRRMQHAKTRRHSSGVQSQQQICTDDQPRTVLVSKSRYVISLLAWSQHQSCTSQVASCVCPSFGSVDRPRSNLSGDYAAYCAVPTRAAWHGRRSRPRPCWRPGILWRKWNSAWMPTTDPILCDQGAPCWSAWNPAGFC